MVDAAGKLNVIFLTAGAAVQKIHSAGRMRPLED
jgi:hypothetical protein